MKSLKEKIKTHRNDPIFREAYKLTKLGLSVHWLVTKDKMPVESKWSTTKTKTWPDLVRDFKPSYNVGWRSGEWSKVGGLYVHCIDVDCRSTDPKHHEEIKRVLAEHFPGLNGTSPRVTTGRGGESRHLLVGLEAPHKSVNISRSKDLVKVKFSKPHAPSTKEAEAVAAGLLTEDDLKAGYRMRAAWEIDFMGTGKQAVAPPSIHPDTGQPYTWAVPFTVENLKQFTFNFDKSQKIETEKAEVATITPPKAFVNLESFNLREDIIHKIHHGFEGGVDHSAALFGVIKDLVKTGMPDLDIASALTDPAYVISEIAFDHVGAKGLYDDRNRRLAMRWILRQNVFKATTTIKAEQASGIEMLTADCPPEVLLSDAQAEKQYQQLIGVKPWRQQLERGGKDGLGKPLKNLKNTLIALRGLYRSDCFKFNEFDNFIYVNTNRLFGYKREDKFNDNILIALKNAIVHSGDFEPSSANVFESVDLIARENKFHPVREYLMSLTWDGVPRLDTWIARYAGGTEDHDLMAAYGRIFLTAMVARIFQPGCKFDHMLILEGYQGVGKSTLALTLAGSEWFSDATFNVMDKDSVMTIQGNWVVEMGELISMNRGEADRLKEYVSRKIDRIRPPYERGMKDFPRQTVFIGTTNQKEYLKDTTGNRRFWPVAVTKCDFEALKRDRDQLFAEAVEAFSMGQPLYIDDPRIYQKAVEAQQHREPEDIWTGIIEEFINSQENQILLSEASSIPIDFISMKDIFSDAGPLRGVPDHNANQQRAGIALRRLGYVSRDKRVSGQGALKRWVKK